MTASHPYHLLAVDPGMASMGIAGLQVEGFGRWNVIHVETVHTNPKDKIQVRLERIRRAIHEVSERIEPKAAVIECNTESKTALLRRDGRRGGDPSSINKLMLAIGALYGALPLPAMQICMVSTSRWWPRRGRSHLPEAELVERVRAHLKIKKGDWSEHALTAVALGDWWTRNDGVPEIASLPRVAHGIITGIDRAAGSITVDTPPAP